MLSIEILRTNKNMRVIELIERAQISKQSYYNFFSGLRPISESTIQRLADVLDCPYLQSLHLLDRLYTNGIKISGIIFPDYIPEKIRRQLLKEHPVFLQPQSQK